jgi:hypothetical protein
MTGALPTSETGEISRRDVVLASAAFLLAGALPDLLAFIRSFVYLLRVGRAHTVRVGTSGS